MNKPNISKIVKNIGTAVSRRSPEILIGIGIAGGFTTVVLAVTATPKAMELIEEERIFKEKEYHEGGIFTEKEQEKAFELTPIEIIRVAWKPYIPAAVTGVLSAACIIGASSKYVRRNAALATAYKLSETALTEYKEKVIETIGEKKEKTVRDKIAKDKIEKNPVSKSQVIVTGKGSTRCFEPISGRYFDSDIETIKKAVNELNRQMLSDMYISLSEFYDEIGLDRTKISDELGWNVDEGLIEIDFSSQIADDGTPCIVVDYVNPPRYGFSKLI